MAADLNLDAAADAAAQALWVGITEVDAAWWHLAGDRAQAEARALALPILEAALPHILEAAAQKIDDEWQGITYRYGDYKHGKADGLDLAQGIVRGLAKNHASDGLSATHSPDPVSVVAQEASDRPDAHRGADGQSAKDGD